MYTHTILEYKVYLYVSRSICICISVNQQHFTPSPYKKNKETTWQTKYKKGSRETGRYNMYVQRHYVMM